MKKLIRQHYLLYLLYLLGWSVAGIFYLSGAEYGAVWGSILASVYMFFPLLVVVIIEKGIYKNRIREQLLLSFKYNHWHLVAWLMMPAAAFITLRISLLFPGITYSPGMDGLMERFANNMSQDQLDQMKDSMGNLPVHPIWLAV